MIYDKRILPVKESQFRTRLYSEDVEGADSNMGYAKGFNKPILIHSGYNNLINFYNKYDTDYNPAKIGGYINSEGVDLLVLKMFIGVIMINPGIDALGSHSLVQVLYKSHFNKEDTRWSHKMLLDRYYKVKKDFLNGVYQDYMEDNHAKEMIYRYVFYNKDSEFDKIEKMYLTRRFIQVLKDKETEGVIELSIRQLIRQDMYTKITVTRLSRLSDISVIRLNRMITMEQKIAIDKANKTRPFTKEHIAEKFKGYLANLDLLEEHSVSKICSILEISMTSYYQFRMLLKDPPDYDINL